MKLKKSPYIFLSGGGNAQQSRLLDSLFVEKVGERKILYLPVAMKRDKIGYEACFDWIISTLTSHSKNFLDIDMVTNLASVSREYLENFGAIYIGGGNTYKLLDEIRKSGFDKLMIDFLWKGGIIYGGSAGAIVLGKDISIVSEEKDRDISSKGLDLINGYSIKCHYSDNDNKVIRNFVRETKLPVIAIPEGCGLILTTLISQNKILGEGIKIFKQNVELKLSRKTPFWEDLVLRCLV
ncbi:type 1 glutamine amidotransferase-like domain-containing protein [Candidatus Pacearchaeota archaeon]|nr:type 1 glutamine amidotransferase-like domain-containing protein [Candidatus Pacearchaeota archaeon]OIO41611.1 MAG: hypothetical protein AUJ63_05375 [Candidatus Pacearchaeota archaeon CG1_02_35_32]